MHVARTPSPLPRWRRDPRAASVAAVGGRDTTAERNLRSLGHTALPRPVPSSPCPWVRVSHRDLPRGQGSTLRPTAVRQADPRCSGTEESMRLLDPRRVVYTLQYLRS